MTGMTRLLSILTITLISFTATNMVAQDKIQWLTWEEMQVLQERESRKVIVDVYTEWCSWCKRMDKNTFENIDIARYINDNYYAVKFDAEYKKPIEYKGAEYKYVKSGRRGHHELAELILKGRLSFPTIVFIDEDLKVIQPIPGYQNPSNMELIVTYFAGDYYKDTPWRKYTSLYQNDMIHDAGFRK